MDEKSACVEIANCFYRDRVDEGFEKFLAFAGQLGSMSGAAEWINDLFDAMDRKDFLYAADILKYEIAKA